MDINTEVHNAFEVIKNGGIILYPTDTVWGIGCDATNEEAVKKIYALKQREETKSMIVLMNGERMMYNIFKEISPEIIKGVDYVVNLHHDKVCKNPSTIIKLGLDSQVKVIRK